MSDVEIEAVEHELNILRTRYALYARWSRVLRVFCMITLPLALVMIVAIVVDTFQSDPLATGFIIAVFSVVIACLWYLAPRNWRWIDLASSPVRSFSLATEVSWSISYGGSDARSIERQIAEREARLVELRTASGNEGAT